MKKLSLIGSILALSAAAAFAGSGFIATPFSFDPDHTGDISAAWSPSIGEPDANGFGLLLQKNGPTTDNSAAGASIKGVSGITLTELGFDYKNGGHCGAGAPRFNVQASDGFHFLGGCSNGTPMPAPAAGWTRVRIDPSNPAQAFPPIASGATIVSISLIFDEGTDTGPDFTGAVILDNIDVNGTLIGKPGNAK